MSGGGAGGTTQGLGNVYAQPQPGGGMGNASAQPYNPTGGAPVQSSSPSNMGSAMGAMFGMLGQPPGNASAQTPTQSPLQAPQQPSPMGEMTAQPAVMPPGMQNQMPPPGMQPSQNDTQQKLNEVFARNLSGMQPAMPPGMQPGLQPGMPPGMQMGMQPAFGSGMPSDLQPGMPPGGQQVDQYTRQLGGLAPPTQVGQPLPPGFGRQLGADEQAPNPYLQDRMRSLGVSGQQPQGPQMPFGIQPGDGGSGFPPMQTPFQMPDGGGQLGSNPYLMSNPYPGPGKFSQPLSGGIGSLASSMAQPQSKQQMKEQMRQIQRMGPMPRARPGGQPQQMFNDYQQFM